MGGPVRKVSLPTNFPSSFPTPGGWVPTSATSNGTKQAPQSIVVMFSTPQTVSDAANSLQSALQGSGWTTTKIANSGDFANYGFVGNGWKGSFLVNFGISVSAGAEVSVQLQSCSKACAS